jgi:hypothetical protein
VTRIGDAHGTPSGTGFLNRLLALDRRWLFIAVGLSVAIPILVPIGFPVKAGPEASDYVAELEKLEPGDTILFSFDYEADTRAELDPMALATFRYCFRKDVRIVALTNYAGGPGIAEAIFEQAAAEYDKTYGRDFVFLGYNTDWQGTMLRLGESFRATFPTDHYGARTDTLAVMEGVDRYADVPLLVSISASALAEYWAIFARGRYDQTVITGNTAIQAILVYPYYNTGQIAGFLGGLKGASELEHLTGLPGAAIPGMDPQSAAHLLMVGFIVMGNVAFILQKRRARREERRG